MPDYFFTGDDGALYDTRNANWHNRAPLRPIFRKTFAEIDSVAKLLATLRAGAYTSIGCYPLAIILSDGGLISFATARDELANLVSALRDARDNPRENSGWRPIGCDILWEGDAFDAHSGEPLETAYGADD